MRKDDLDWGIYDDILETNHRRVEICSTTYRVNENTAAICHALLLLCDSINDKHIPVRECCNGRD